MQEDPDESVQLIALKTMLTDTMRIAKGDGAGSDAAPGERPPPLAPPFVKWGNKWAAFPDSGEQTEAKIFTADGRLAMRRTGEKGPQTSHSFPLFSPPQKRP